MSRQSLDFPYKSQIMLLGNALNSLQLASSLIFIATTFKLYIDRLELKELPKENEPSPL